MCKSRGYKRLFSCLCHVLHPYTDSSAMSLELLYFGQLHDSPADILEPFLSEVRAGNVLGEGG